MPSRRSVLVGLGGLVAGGGALIGTGAFTTVEAERTVNIETEGDASAFLGLEAADRPDDTGSEPGNETTNPNENEYVEETGGTIQINLGGDGQGENGLNQNAITTFRELVTITNNGTQTVDSLSLLIEPDSGSISDGTFHFTLTDTDDESQAVIDNGGDAITGQFIENTTAVIDELGPGNAVDFGMIIDLIDGGDGSGNLPTTNYTLTITAETADSS